MPFTPAANGNKVEENQYFIGDHITMGKFTSCAGVFALFGDGQVFGAHLVLVDTNGNEMYQGSMRGNQVEMQLNDFGVGQANTLRELINSKGADHSGVTEIWTVAHSAWRDAGRQLAHLAAGELDGAVNYTVVDDGVAEGSKVTVDRVDALEVRYTTEKTVKEKKGSKTTKRTVKTTKTLQKNTDAALPDNLKPPEPLEPDNPVNPNNNDNPGIPDGPNNDNPENPDDHGGGGSDGIPPIDGPPGDLPGGGGEFGE